MNGDEVSTNRWSYDDFELEISKGRSSGEYLVRVLRSPGAGEPEEEIRLPYSEDELRDKLEELEDALYETGSTRSSNTRPDEAPSHLSQSPEKVVQDFGADLYQSLFTGDVQTSYRMSLSNAKNQKKGLRLKLRVHPSSGLTHLPWEFLYDPSRKRYLSLSSRRPLVRYLTFAHPAEPLRVELPLRILGLVANPSGLSSLNVRREKELVEKATEKLRAQGLVQLDWVEGETRDALQQAVWKYPCHVFHFVGHGDFDSGKQEGGLILADDEGKPYFCSAEELADLLMESTDSDELRLVFLNACQGAKGTENDAFSSAAASLVDRGVAASVAMQYDITDKAGIEFARKFYEALANALPVDAAVAWARSEVKRHFKLQWGTPVLYMHSPDGRIFSLQNPSTSTADALEGGREDKAQEVWHEDESHANGAKVARPAVVNGGQQPVGLWSRVRTRARENKKAILAGSCIFLALALGFVVANRILQTTAIENLLISHYEDVAEGNYRAAFADFGKVEQERLGGLDAYVDDITSWCPAVSADVGKPEVDYLVGNKATGTVNVGYEHRCGESPHKFESQSKYVWNLSRVGGEWKLAERDDQETIDPVFYNYPEETYNGGETTANFNGEEQGHLESIKVSNAVDSAKNGCDETVKYRLANLVDGRGDTTWQVAGTGVGEWVQLGYDAPIKVSEVGLIPGYDKTDPCDDTDRFYQMYVVREARVQFSDGSSVDKSFEREPKMQYVNIPDTETTSIRITILDTYPPGEKLGATPYDYTLGKAAISDIKVEGTK